MNGNGIHQESSQEVSRETEMPQVVVLQLNRNMDEEIRHNLLGAVLKRVRRFDEQYNPQGVPTVHCREIERDFAKDRDHSYFIAVAITDGQVVGHLLARVYEYYGKLYVHVEQMVIDKGTPIKLEQEHQIFAALQAWQREIYADPAITTAALNEAHVRRLRRFYGFKQQFILMSSQ